MREPCGIKDWYIYHPPRHKNKSTRSVSSKVKNKIQLKYKNNLKQIANIINTKFDRKIRKRSINPLQVAYVYLNNQSKSGIDINLEVDIWGTR